jgi:hypothetical protein
MAAALLAYGAIGIYYDDIYIPGKRSRGVHLHGTAAWIMYGAFVCASLSLLSVLADHCDSRAGGRPYHVFARVTQGAGWALFIGALALSLARPTPLQW